MSIPKKPKAAIGLENATVKLAAAVLKNASGFVPLIPYLPRPLVAPGGRLVTTPPDEARVAVPAPGKTNARGAAVLSANPVNGSVPTPESPEKKLFCAATEFGIEAGDANVPSTVFALPLRSSPKYVTGAAVAGTTNRIATGALANREQRPAAVSRSARRIIRTSKSGQDRAKAL
jgi:hypothetical protein